MQLVERVSTLELLQLSGSVLVQELVQTEVAAANLDLDLVAHAPHIDSLGAELIHALGFSHEHNLELLTIRIVVDILSKSLVDDVVLDRDVDSDARFQVNNVLP